MPLVEKNSPSTRQPALPAKSVRSKYIMFGQMFLLVLLAILLSELEIRALFSGGSTWLTYLSHSLAAAIAAGGIFYFWRKDTEKINHLQQLEASLRRSEAQYRTIVEHQTLLVCHFDPDGILTFVNGTYCRYLEREPDDLLGRSLFLLLPPDTVEPAKKHLAVVAQGKKPVLSQDRMLVPGNKNIWIQWTDTPLFNEAGDLIGFQAEGLDVTERFHAEQMLALQRDLAAVLNTGRPLNDIMQEILGVMLQIEQIDSGGVYLVEPQTGDINLIAYTGLPQNYIDQARYYSHDSTQARLVQSGQPLYTHSDALKTDTRDMRRDEGLRALAVVPVMHEGKAVAALNLASHAYDEIPDYVKQMIDILAEQMGNGIARVRAEEALYAGQKNLQALFNTINDFLFILDEQGRIIHTNPVVEQRLGYTFEELRGLSVLAVHPPDRRDEAAQIVADMLAGTRISCPVPLQTKAGDFIPVDTKVVPGIWNDAPVLFGLSRDITELTQSQAKLEASLQEKEVLLKEIHHRVKNNLQIVASLLYLQSKQVSDEATLAALQESRNRVKSMALIHEQLYQSGNLARIDFSVYVQILADQLIQTYHGPYSRISLSVEIENLFLDIATAIPCGLIINELVSNALKHAFAPRQSGQVKIRFTQAGDRGLYTLVVSDNGQGMPEVMTEQINQNDLSVLHHQSLGLRLVDTLVGQLEGNMQVTHDDGTTFVINFNQ